MLALTSIRSRSEGPLAMPDVVSDLQEELLSIIAEESQRLSPMISPLPDVSRIEAGARRTAARRGWAFEQAGQTVVEVER